MTSAQVPTGETGCRALERHAVPAAAAVAPLLPVGRAAHRGSAGDRGRPRPRAVARRRGRHPVHRRRLVDRRPGRRRPGRRARRRARRRASTSPPRSSPRSTPPPSPLQGAAGARPQRHRPGAGRPRLPRHGRRAAARRRDAAARAGAHRSTGAPREPAPCHRLRPVGAVSPPPRGVELLHGVAMEVTVELGRTRMSVRELLALCPGDVLELDRAAGSPADLLVNGRLIARGEVVVVDEDFALRVTEIVAQSQRELTVLELVVRVVVTLGGRPRPVLGVARLGSRKARRPRPRPGAGAQPPGAQPGLVPGRRRGRQPRAGRRRQRRRRPAAHRARPLRAGDRRLGPDRAARRAATARLGGRAGPPALAPGRASLPGPPQARPAPRCPGRPAPPSTAPPADGRLRARRLAARPRHLAQAWAAATGSRSYVGPARRSP